MAVSNSRNKNVSNVNSANNVYCATDLSNEKVEGKPKLKNMIKKKKRI